MNNYEFLIKRFLRLVRNGGKTLKELAESNNAEADAEDDNNLALALRGLAMGEEVGVEVLQAIEDEIIEALERLHGYEDGENDDDE